MTQYQTPIYTTQGGTVLNVASGGTIVIAAGGSIQNSGGQSFAGSMTVSGSLSVTGVIAAPSLTLGGTQARWSFGTLGLASGIGSVQTGLTTVVAAWANVLSGVQGGAGSMSSAVIDPANFANGSVIFRGLAGTLAFTGNNGTVAWAAFGV